LEFKLLEDYSNTFTIPASSSHTHTLLEITMFEMGKKCQVIAMNLLFCENFQHTLGKTFFFSVICVFFSKNSPLPPNQKKRGRKKNTHVNI
jgi:hypothetical protein